MCGFCSDGRQLEGPEAILCSRVVSLDSDGHGDIVVSWDPLDRSVLFVCRSVSFNPLSPLGTTEIQLDASPFPSKEVQVGSSVALGYSVSLIVLTTFSIGVSHHSVESTRCPMSISTSCRGQGEVSDVMSPLAR